MGAEQIHAASLAHAGVPGALSFQAFPVRSEITTFSADSDITDSAASATAMATGVKVQNGALSVALPGDGSDLTTIFELAASAQIQTGLVTTAFVTHATPAGFAAHVSSRSDYEQIADHYLNLTRPNAIFGGGGYGATVETFESAGYSVVTSAAELDFLASSDADHAAALLGTGHLPYIYDGRSDETPSLVDMTTAAIELLTDSAQGYLLVVEAARIDHAAHSNDLARMIPEVVELHHVVRAVRQQVEADDDTLLIVTADHETGGLLVEDHDGTAALPDVSWSSTYHTGVPVPLYARGPGAAAFLSVTDNTYVFEAIRSLMDL